MEDYTTREEYKRLYKKTSYFFNTVEILLALRFVFKALGANIENGVVHLTYFLTDILMIPFNNIFDSGQVGRSAVLEWSVLMAIVLYIFIYYGVLHMLHVAVRYNNEA